MKLKDIKWLYHLVNKGYTLTDKRRFLEITGGYYFIHYRHYGSSAIKNNFKEFRWLINTIFKDYNNDDILIKVS
jgi:hypothetical protein